MHGPSPSKFLVIVPTYNEVDNVPVLLAGIRQHAPAADVLFVDDNSVDQTQDVIKAAMAAQPGRVHLLARPGKLGLGTAYVDGFRWGLARDYDALVEMDADLSHRPEDLAKLIDGLAVHPVVIGSRYIVGGGTQNWGFGRKLISRLGSLYARTILRLKIRDLTGGFNGWRREVIERIDPSSVRSEGYAFQVELKYRAHLAGFPVVELPILFVERRAGQSKMHGGIVTEAMMRVWQLAVARGSIRRQLALSERSSSRAAPRVGAPAER